MHHKSNNYRITNRRIQIYKKYSSSDRNSEQPMRVVKGDLNTETREIKIAKTLHGKNIKEKRSMRNKNVHINENLLKLITQTFWENLSSLLIEMKTLQSP